MKRIELEVKAGVTIYASTGQNGTNQPDRMSSRHFYLADKGSRLELLDRRYYFNVATYTLDFDEKYRQTYAYAPEESWTTYSGDLGGNTYRQEDYVFTDQRYFRICLKRTDGGVFSPQEERHIDSILCFYSTAAQEERPSAVFHKEIGKVAERIAMVKEENDLVLAVLTDTHYTVNGTWEDTAANLQAVHHKVGFDSVIHLGDFTDGMVPREITCVYAKRILEDLRKMNIPMHIVLGNHDANYFAGNQDVMPIPEQVQLYQKCSESYKSDKGCPYYYMDYEKENIRCVFLSAYDNNEKLRYGFDLKQIEWMAATLQNTPTKYLILVFAHSAPLAGLDYWADEIRNGDVLMSVMEKHQGKYKNILAYIHGHTHADFIFKERAFPIISIGCAKCEDMQEKKPEKAVTQKRELGKATQDLWDVLIVKPKKKQLKFVRFGAGKDRVIG